MSIDIIHTTAQFWSTSKPICISSLFHPRMFSLLALYGSVNLKYFKPELVICYLDVVSIVFHSPAVFLTQNHPLHLPYIAELDPEVLAEERLDN